MPKHHISIDDETMTVLRSSTVTENSVRLPAGQLARPLYEKVNKVLTTAGGKWNRSQQAHIFTIDPRETLGLAVEKGAILDTKKSTQAFYTPVDLARRVVEMASVEGRTVLEPSAGRGSLATACMDQGADEVFCVEQDAKSAEYLLSLGFGVAASDFMVWTPTVRFDRVVMNPPFTAGQDVAHVARAFDFLRPDGRLVAIMSPGWEFKNDKKSVAFRELVTAHGRVEARLDEGAFKESGTNVRTVIVILDK